MPADLSVFRDAAPFRGFKDQDWEIFSKLLKEIKVPAGSVVFKENDPGDGFYWVRSGKVRIIRKVVPEGKNAPQEQLLEVLTAGSIFGEMALAEGSPRSADAVAENDLVLFFFSGAEYERLQRDNPGTALRIQDMLVVTLCSRIRSANRIFEIVRFWCS